MGNSQSKTQDIQITLISRKSVPGFKHKRGLTVSAMSGETYDDLLARFNNFRAPENQIAHFYNESGAIVRPDDYVVAGRVYIN